MNSSEIDRALVEYDRWCEGRNSPCLNEFASERGLSETVVSEMRQTLESGGELAEMMAGRTRRASIDEDPQTLSGEFENKFRFLRPLGAGGMGSVWIAEQVQPIQRQVAIKLWRPGLVSDDTLKRFVLERQALAALKHPNIAIVYDAGQLKDGRPYLVMEYIPGQKITDYCNERKLDLNQRLQIVLQVCDAVEHAHRKNLIHRDLKPGNILVTEIDGEATSKLIDFGLVKDLSRLPGDESITKSTAVVGSVMWMSPEQSQVYLSGDSVQIDGRTDVYSLGIVLYELLTGTTPLSADFVRRSPPGKVFEAIQEQIPLAPSVHLKRTSEDSGRTESATGDNHKSRANSIKKDLDWIVMKAVEKEPGRRYASIAELAGDIRRYIAGDAIQARPPSALYRVRKVISRHRTLVGSAVAIGLILIAATLLTGWFQNQTRHANELVAQQQAHIDQLFDSTLDKIKDLNYEINLTGNGTRLKRDQLLAWEKEVEEWVKSVPVQFNSEANLQKEYDLRMTYAEALESAGLYYESIAQHDRLSDSFDNKRVDRGDARAVRNQISLLRQLLETNQVERARAIASIVRGIAVDSFGRFHELSILASIYCISADSTLTSSKESCEQIDGIFADAEKELGVAHPSVVVGNELKGDLLVVVEMHKDALNCFAKAKEISEQINGAEHNRTMQLEFKYWKAKAELYADDQLSLDELEAFIDGLEERLGPDHLVSLKFKTLFCHVLTLHGRPEQVVQMIDSNFRKCEDLLGQGNPVTLSARRQKMSTLANTGRYDEGIEFCKESAEVFDEYFIRCSPSYSLFSRFLQAKMTAIKGDFATSLDIAVKNLELIENYDGDQLHAHSIERMRFNFLLVKTEALIGLCRIADARATLQTIIVDDEREYVSRDKRAAVLQAEVDILKLEGNFKDALKTMRTLENLYKEYLPEIHPLRLTANSELQVLNGKCGRNFRVVKYGKELLKLLDGKSVVRDIARKKLRSSAIMNIVSAYIQMGELEHAEEYCNLYLDSYEPGPGDHPELVRAKASIGVIRYKQGELDESAKIMLEVLIDLEDYKEHPKANPAIYSFNKSLCLQHLEAIANRRGDKEAAEKYRRQIDAMKSSLIGN